MTFNDFKSFHDWLIMEKSSGTSKPDFDTFSRWFELVNMTADELSSFMKSDEGKEAGLSRKEANKEGIHTGRQSAEWILKMLPKANNFKDAEKNWTPQMWYWCGRQVSFISRMRGNKGPLYDEKNKKTRKHLSLLIWGHNPEKNLRKKPKS